ncbi:MAG: OmpA family protein, partial [Flavobacteriales bacterium]|nr:OmpA family protein [Flavobacteriales bacterium]
RGMIADSLRKSGLKGQIKWTDSDNKVHTVLSDEKGQYEMYVEGQMFYELECSVLGYKTKKIKFMKQTLYQEIKFLDFPMLSLKAGENFVLNDIYFHPGTYAFKEKSYGTLKELAKFMHTNDLAQIEIQGHTNGKGVVKKNPRKAHLGPEWNFSGNEKKLSKLRAEAVKHYLRNDGISEERLATVGLGAKKMLYPQPRNKRERDANKRVEVSILSLDYKHTSALLDK